METIVKADSGTLHRVAHSLTGLDFHSTHIPMWVFDRKTLQFLAVNRAAVQHYGFTKEEFLDMTILDIRPVEDLSRLLHATLCPHESNPEPEIWRHRTKKGRVFPVQVTAYQVEFAEHTAELVVAQELSATVNEFAKKSKTAKA